MLDFRYHVASLVAVFLALIVGILVGVGISGRGFVDKSERRKLENRIDRLQSRVDELSTENDSLRTAQLSDRAFVTDAYPVLMHDRLSGKHVAVIVVGAGGGSTGHDVQQTLADAGTSPSRYRAIELPVQTAAVRRALRGYAGSPRLSDVGHELAQEWTTGGKTPVADALSPVLVAEQRGTNAKTVDGVVVVQSAQPRGAATKRFLEGFYAGLGTAGVPVVGVEETAADLSDVPTFNRYPGFSTVDDVDRSSGRLALALLLAGAPGGNFGVRTTADAPLPKIEQAPTPGA